MEFWGFSRFIRRSQRVTSINVKIHTIITTERAVIDFCFLDIRKRINRTAIRLNHPPMDFVRMRAVVIKSKGMRSCKCIARKNIIIKYPAKIFGEGNVPMARFESRMSRA